VALTREEGLPFLHDRKYLRRAVEEREMSTREIAAELGVSRNTVKEKLRKYRIPHVVRPHPKT
jgi:transposase